MGRKGDMRPTRQAPVGPDEEQGVQGPAFSALRTGRGIDNMPFRVRTPQVTLSAGV